MSHDSCTAALASNWLVFFSSMARTKVTPRKADEQKTKKVKTRTEVHAAPVDPPVLAEPPVPDVETPPTPSEIERRRAEAEKLEEVRRSPELSLTWQFRWLWRLGHLHQMGRSEPEGSSDWPWEARLPGRNSWRPEKWRSPRGTGWGWWPSMRSAGFKRVPTFSSINYPFCI